MGLSKLGTASDRSNTSRNSAERLFEEQVNGQHFTTAYPTKSNGDHDVEQGFPMKQIHVKQDVHIDGQPLP